MILTNLETLITRRASRRNRLKLLTWFSLIPLTLCSCSSPVRPIFHEIASFQKHIKRHGLSYSIWTLEFVDRISSKTVAPSNFVYAFANYSITNPTNIPQKAPSDTFIVQTLDGKIYDPDELGTKNFDAGCITNEPWSAQAYNSQLTLPPHKACDVYAVYLLPKTPALRNATLLFPEEVNKNR